MNDDAIKKLLEEVWDKGYQCLKLIHVKGNRIDEVEFRQRAVETAAQQIRQELALARIKGYEKGVADTLKVVNKPDLLKQLKKKNFYE